MVGNKVWLSVSVGKGRGLGEDTNEEDIYEELQILKSWVFFVTLMTSAAQTMFSIF